MGEVSGVKTGKKGMDGNGKHGIKHISSRSRSSCEASWSRSASSSFSSFSCGDTQHTTHDT